MNRSELQIRIDELADDFLERRRDGEKPTIEEYTDANPDIATPLRKFLKTILMVDDIKDEPEFLNSGSIVGNHDGSNSDSFPELDDYEIIREIGRGGMGIVYEAHHVSLDRTVALKVLPSGLFQNQGAVKRFQLEARSAARLHHTNIVPIFDVDQKEDVCYYAMQFIEGQSLDYVVKGLRQIVDEPNQNDESDVQPAAALSDTMKMGLSSTSAGRKPFYQNIARLGKQIAEAIHHAHENGIIHRDIKPANLMLDVAGTAWIMDFGLVKTDESNLTQTGDVVGTLRYMSPERFAGQCDRRSDVYSLGLTLYELLGQKPAFENSDRLSLIDSIKTVEPEPLRKLVRSIPLDLETIVEKAIEKDPRRRYSTANELAADLNRFAAGQPIHARRVGSAERLWLWAKKRKALAASLAALSAVLVFVAVGSSIAAYYFRDLAGQNLSLAQSNEDKTEEAEFARNEALLKAEEANKAKDEAETSQDRTNDVLSLVTGAFESVDPNFGADADILARDVLLQVEEALISSTLDNEGRLQLLDKLTRCYIAIGEEQSALSTAENYFNLAKSTLGDDDFQTASARELVAHLYKTSGRHEEAISLFEHNVEFVKNNPESEDQAIIIAVGNLARAYYVAGRRKEALELHEENVPFAKESLGNAHPIYIGFLKARALCYQQLGQLDKAIAQFRDALKKCRTHFGPDHPDTLDSMSILAVALNENGAIDEAITLQEQALELAQGKLGDDHPDTLNIMHGLSRAYANAGRYEEAIGIQQSLVDLAETIYGENHPRTLSMRGSLAISLNQTERRAEALEIREENLRRTRIALGDKHPDTLTSMSNLAGVYIHSGRIKDAIPMLREVLAGSLKLYGEGDQRVLSTMHNLGHAYQKDGQLAESIEMLEKTRDQRVTLLGSDHPLTLSVTVHLASAYMDDKRFEEGIPMMEQALDSSRKSLGNSHPRTLIVLHYLSGYLMKNGQFKEAEPLLKENALAQKETNPDGWMRFNVESLYGNVLLQQGKLEKAEEPLLSAYKGMKRIGLPLGREGSLAYVVGLLKELAEAKGESEQAEKWQQELDELKKDDQP